MNVNPLNVKSFSLLVLGAAVLTGAGSLVAYSVNSQQTSVPAAPEYAAVHQPLSITDAPDAAQAWKQLLAAADSGDRAALRQYVAAGGPQAGQLADAFSNLLVQTAAAQDAAAQRFGKLPAEHVAFFARNDAEAFSKTLDGQEATVCAVLPVCGERYEPVPVQMQKVAGRWRVVVDQSLRGTVAHEPEATTIRRLNRSAEVFRVAATQISAGAYSSAEDAVYAIQNGLWHAGLQGQ